MASQLIREIYDETEKALLHCGYIAGYICRRRFHDLALHLTIKNVFWHFLA